MQARPGCGLADASSLVRPVVSAVMSLQVAVVVGGSCSVRALRFDEDCAGCCAANSRTCSFSSDGIGAS